MIVNCNKYVQKCCVKLNFEVENDIYSFSFTGESYFSYSAAVLSHDPNISSAFRVLTFSHNDSNVSPRSPLREQKRLKRTAQRTHREETSSSRLKYANEN